MRLPDDLRDAPFLPERGPVPATRVATGQSQPARREGVAAADRALAHPGLEPAPPLGGRAVRERVRVDPPGRALLDAVVADSLGGVDRPDDVVAVQLGDDRLPVRV